ncbi:MAG: glycosyl transferase group 1 [Solirubrobacterales bacterium]|nr:glycosyl transferase group 1 [Solirubrobacterales bacterium]
MRILLVVPMVPQADGIGAIPKLLHAELVGLRERHDITVVGSFGELTGQAEAAASLMRSDLDAHFVDRRRSRSPLRRWSVRTRLAAGWATRPWPWRAVSATAGVQPALDRLATDRSFDLVAVEEDLMSVLRFPRGVPVVLTEHEAFQAPATSWRAQRLRERPERLLRVRDWRRWKSFQLAAWERADLIQVYSEGDAAEIGKRSPRVAERIRVNPFGLVAPPLADPARVEPDTVLFAGTFTHLPNRDAALWLANEIMPRVRDRHPDAQLRLVGSAPPREVLALAGAKVDVIADVTSMTPHLEAAAVVIAPVRNGGGMRMKVLEAMAMRKAVVTTALGAEGFTGFGADPPLLVADSAPGLAAATAELLGDESRRLALADRARAFAVEHHGPAAWARRLEVVYEEALGAASMRDRERHR